MKIDLNATLYKVAFVLYKGFAGYTDHLKQPVTPFSGHNSISIDRQLTKNEVDLRRLDPTLFLNMMTIKKANILALLLLCSIATLLPAQSAVPLTNQQRQTEQRKGLRFLTTIPENLSQEDIEKINAYNFEPYRKASTRVKVQLVRGPLLELLSKEEMPQKPLATYNGTATNNKAAIQTSNTLYDLIVQLNIGLGYHKIN